MLIRVPATSANLGPGFDCFGLAFQCYNDIEFFPADALRIEGCDEAYQNEDNLAFLGWKAAFAAAGRETPPVHIRFGRTEVPVCRGLGSSAALSVAGAAAANGLYELGLDKQGLLDAVTAVEGHPDNVAPCIFGGLTASAMAGTRAVTVCWSVAESLRFTAIIPDFELSTALARSVLPQSVSRADAIYNVSRAALLLHSLGSGDLELLRDTMDDRLHQPYRWGLIRNGARAVEIARECGAAGVCISGAGPTILCVTDDGGFSARLRDAVEREFPGWEVRSMPVDRQGVQVLP